MKTSDLVYILGKLQLESKTNNDLEVVITDGMYGDRAKFEINLVDGFYENEKVIRITI